MIAWLNPAALSGLVLLAGPLLVHLLLRHRADRVPFPSLRFVRPSRTAAVRVRLPSDLALLFLRMTIVALAVAALAQPLVLAPPRVAAWNARMARAIVVDVSESMTADGSGSAAAGAADVATVEARGAIFVARIDAVELRRALARAVSALGAAPPARREIVVVSDFQRGMLTRADLDTVPPGIGIRLVQVGTDSPDRRLRGLDLFGADTSSAQDVQLSGSSTAVSIVPGSGRLEGLRLVAPKIDSLAIRALERAVASAGAPAPSPQQPLTIVFAGAPGIEAVHALSATWMLRTVLRLGNDREIVEACTDGVSANGDSRTAAREGREWHVVCRDRLSRPLVRAAAAGSQMVLDVAAPASALLSAAVVRGALTARHGSVAHPEAEPRRMTAAELGAWSRGAPPVAADAWRSGQSSDGRWCWALALGFLAVEAAVRRRRADTTQEARADAA